MRALQSQYRSLDAAQPTTPPKVVAKNATTPRVRSTCVRIPLEGTRSYMFLREALSYGFSDKALTKITNLTPGQLRYRMTKYNLINERKNWRLGTSTRARAVVGTIMDQLSTNAR